MTIFKSATSVAFRCVFRPLRQTLRLPKHVFQSTKPFKRPNTSQIRGNDTSLNEGTFIPVPSTVANLPIWQRLGPLTRTFEAFSRSQRRRPYTTQFFGSLVIYALGDLSAQSISGEDYNPLGTGRALIISAGSSIPAYKWFIFLGANFNYSSKTLSLGTKVVVNQIVFTPIFNSYFFGMQSVLSNLPEFSLQKTWEHIKKTVPTSAINSCKLWPAVTAFNFTFVSPQHRSLFAGVVAIGWQTYLSFLNRQAEHVENQIMHSGRISDQNIESAGGSDEIPEQSRMTGAHKHVM